jgi:Kelch motif/Galactose oxidase, central domain
MVIGGFDSEPLDVPHVPANPLASCEIYDPMTNTWTIAAPHPVSAGWRWAAALSNGMILVAGGSKSLTSVVASSHLYDPKTNTWIATQPLPVATTNPHAFMRAIGAKYLRSFVVKCPRTVLNYEVLSWTPTISTI